MPYPRLTSRFQDNPYTIIVDGSGAVSERKLAKHAAGVPLATSVTVVSNTVSGAVRTVVMTRSLSGATRDHYTFDSTTLSIPFISAVGLASAFGPHNAAPHGAATMYLWPATPVCVCSVPAAPFGQGSGVLKYLPTGATVAFNQHTHGCYDQPREDLIAQRNPSCDIRSYVGGLAVCRHGWFLLDAEQDLPWPDQPLVYYKKFRVGWQQEFSVIQCTYSFEWN